MTSRLRALSRRRVVGLRIRAEQDGAIIEGVIVHADRFPESGALDCVTVRTDDGAEVLVECGCYGEVVSAAVRAA